MVGKEGAAAEEAAAKLDETVPLLQGRPCLVALSGWVWEVEAAYLDAASLPYACEESETEQIFAVFVAA